MADRYFVESPIVGPVATLHASEAHHLIHVMRARAGAEVQLFDGSGAEFLARIERVGRADVELAILERQEVDRELPVTITLGVALPKGDRQRWLVEKAVELGVTRLAPLATRRGVAQPAREVLERLRRAVIEASKQCGRNRLLEITPGTALADYLADSPAGAVRWFAHPGGQSIATALTAASDARTTQYCLAVGPEGGFSDEESAAAAAHGWQPVDLGRRILRVETAALCLASNIAARAS